MRLKLFVSERTFKGVVPPGIVHSGRIDQAVDMGSMTKELFVTADMSVAKAKGTERVRGAIKTAEKLMIREQMV